MGREDEVKLIAYKIWEEEGFPDGKDCEHWFKAETAWEQRQKSENEAKNVWMDPEPAARKNMGVMATRKKSPRKLT